ncbi:MAG: LPS export ABC transporter ATP-binding protein [Phycisphaeraceae bacterium]|nr:LPS export ABC transporter ATP-binding protein [Phycisphaerales bacterium]MCB9859962.1 LPS export ABC transporter ATP-binding protein [Phycisphaeraceae bacterium]
MGFLQANHLRKSFGGRTVVDNVSYHVERAEIVGLLGRNGAGKTTSFRMSIGMIDADDGQVVFDGHDVSGLPMFQRARLGMGYLSQEPSIFGRMTCEQNLLAILETLPIDRKERKRRATKLLERFGLTHKANDRARTCSGGERRKLEIARALVTTPKVILLDEPFSGVDPIAVEDLQKIIRRLCEGGIAFLITDHNVQQTLRVCNRAYILDSGKIFAEGTPKALINDERVRNVYLGSMFRGDEFDQTDTSNTSTSSTAQSPPKPRTNPTAQNGTHHPAQSNGAAPAQPAPTQITPPRAEVVKPRTRASQTRGETK